MSFNMYKIAGIAVIITIFAVYFNNLRMTSQQAKIDDAIVEYAGKTSKAKAKETIKEMEKIDENFGTFDATDVICDSDGISCELW